MATGPDITCPKCGAEPRLRCRSLTTNRTTDTHMARYDALYDRSVALRQAHLAKIRLPEVSEVCSCGNRFDGDNLCMISACQEES